MQHINCKITPNALKG